MFKDVIYWGIMLNLCLGPCTANGQTVNEWKGIVGDNSWLSPANWSQEMVPTSNHLVVIGDDLVNINQPATAYRIELFQDAVFDE